ncbi:hypothetical protein JH26_23815 [Microvirga sp. BSC39]|nr:hypothetical protein JH26_23815 [Microvirga sp. BSC39]
MKICGRCHRSATRLIRKHLCFSCFNREREVIKGRNAKGTKPLKLTALDARSVTFQRVDRTVHTRSIDRTLGTTEVIKAVLHGEKQHVQFCFCGEIPVTDRADLGLHELDPVE